MRKITFLLAILVSICGFAAEVEPDAVRVTPTNGDPVVFLFCFIDCNDVDALPIRR